MTSEIQIRILSCLSVLHNAMVTWNTLHIGPVVEQLRAEGHTIDACEPDHPYTGEVQLTRSASTT